MPQRTNLNINPYYDDFDAENNYYRVLFKPGFPVQARELTTSQSILQNQIEKFARHTFKDGSVVIPGGVSYDFDYQSIQIESTFLGLNVSDYISSFVGKEIRGQQTGLEAKIVNVLLSSQTSSGNITLFIKYTSGTANNEVGTFQDGETLITEENVVYGNTTISSGNTFAVTIATNAAQTGSAAHVDAGTFFFRGYFVDVKKQTVVLDEADDTPSYRVGLQISEEIVNAKQDNTLYDNAKGFTNFAAPGADRFKIQTTLVKKSLTDLNDSSFIELLRIDEGVLLTVPNKPQYSVIKDYIAERDFEKTGNFFVEPFDITFHECLNNRRGNNGLFYDNQVTDEGNVPSNDLACVSIGSGKAYVKGYDINRPVATILDIPKPRTTRKVEDAFVPYNLGSQVQVNNVYGHPAIKREIQLYSQRLGANGTTLAGERIGDCRCYSFNLTSGEYLSARTPFTLFVYDVTLYQKLHLANPLSAAQLPAGAYITGQSSGASGYVTAAGTGSAKIFVRDTSGTFIQGETIYINGIKENARKTLDVRVYDSTDVKSVYQQASALGLQADFYGDVLLVGQPVPGFKETDQFNITAAGKVSINSKTLTGIKTDSLLAVQQVGFTTTTLYRVKDIAKTGLEVTIEATTDVVGITTGALPAADITSTIIAFTPIVQNINQDEMYVALPQSDVATVDLKNSSLEFHTQLGALATNGSGEMTITNTSGVQGAIFEAFDEERYSIVYSDGIIATITENKFEYNSGSNTITIKGLRPSQTNVVANVVMKKPQFKAKSKVVNRSQIVNITRSANKQSGSTANNSLNDGLSFSTFFGTRVQDKKICLNYPEVIEVLAVHESFNSDAPTFDKLNLTSVENVQTSAIIGESIIGASSKAIARLVGKPGASQVEFVYLTDARFIVGEDISFDESDIVASIDSIVNGSYKDITYRYSLSNGQEHAFSNYASLTRSASSGQPPTRQLKVVFDYYSVPSGDDGDVVTVDSYPQSVFRGLIPDMESERDGSTTGGTNVLDFRPAVAIYDPATATAPPFSFASRDFGALDKPALPLAVGEGSVVSFEYYLARKDKLFLNKNGDLSIVQGVPGEGDPDDLDSDHMLLGTISLPAYTDETDSIDIDLENPRRYTFADIAKLDNKISALESAVTLSMLEEETKNVDIRDATGKARFKNGFFADNFQSSEQIDDNHPDNKCEQTDEGSGTITPLPSNASLKTLIVTKEETTSATYDSTIDYDLLDENVVKRGDLLMLKYEEKEWVKQLAATGVSNINPFNVITWAVAITLKPDIDSWSRKIQTQQTVKIKGKQKTVKVVTKRYKWVRTGYWWGWWGRWRWYWRRYRWRWCHWHWGYYWYRRGWRYGYRWRWGWYRYRWRYGYWGWWGWGHRCMRRVATYTTTYKKVDVPTPTPADKVEKIKSQAEEYMRSRNVLVDALSCKPKTRYYHFFDGSNTLDIVPKLLEIKDVTGAFKVGETVIGKKGKAKIKFRVCTPNHKRGKYNKPDRTYSINPYNTAQNIPSTYSKSSTIINVDVSSMAEEAQGSFSGYVVNDMLLTGQQSGATAKVSQIRLVSDKFGDIQATFFIRDPLANPAPPNRFKTGTKQFVLNTDINNTKATPGSTKISSGQADYKSTGVVETWRTTKFKVYFHRDPLAQSFTTDASGVFLTSLDVWFYTKDEKLPVFLEVRQMQLGIPTRNVLEYSEVKLDPDQVTLVPDTGASAGNDTYKTTFNFKSPVFCSPNTEFCVVLLSESDSYEVFLARMGSKTLNFKALGLGQNSQHSKQWGAGSLFKSQNGSIWTPTQEEDLTFRLKRAKFTATSGTVYMHNPDLDVSNNYIRRLDPDSFQVVSRSVTVGIDTVTNGTVMAGILTTGRKIGEATAAEGGTSGKSYVFGTIESTGGPIDLTFGSYAGISTVAIGGTDYIDGQYNNVDLFAVTGNGVGAKANIFVENGNVTAAGATIVNAGHGYGVGDIVGITTADAGGAGSQAQLSIEATSGIDRLFLEDVRGNTFVTSEKLVYFDDAGTRTALGSTTITLSARTGPTSNEGDMIIVYLPNHGMYSGSNKITISGCKDLADATQLSADVTSTSTVISVASTIGYETFEGMPVSATNPGYVLVDDELISYTAVGEGTLTIGTRGVDGTVSTPHTNGEEVDLYELQGVSLRRINTTHDIDPYEFDIDNFYIRIQRDQNGTDRSDDGTLVNAPLLSFADSGAAGGDEIDTTTNLLYSSIKPNYRVIKPTGKTSVTAQARTITGTSPSGNEISYVDKGYVNIDLGNVNEFSDVRMIASKVNEDTYNTELFRNKSFTTAITLQTTDENVSPSIDSTVGATEFEFFRLNDPVSDYALDGRVNIAGEDPHASAYVSKNVSLENESVALKVIIEAYRSETSDFRVAYQIETSAEGGAAPWRLFPGYDNLKDTDGNGLGDEVITQLNNNGRPDRKIRASAPLSDEFIQYEFNAQNITEFTAFRIKIMMSGTNAADPPKFRSIRAIAYT